MTKNEMRAYKKFAKDCCKIEGIRVSMSDMILLETGSGYDGCLEFVGDNSIYITYVMFEDRKTGRQYQCFFGVAYYNEKHESLYKVVEYI